MRYHPSTLLTLLAASLVMPTTPAQATATPRVLVYTATAGYRHDSIPTAIEVLGQQQAGWNVSFAFSEDPNMFTNDTLSTFDGVMFVLNSDQVLNDTGMAALQTFFQKGGVYTGVHSGSACLYNDTNYQQAVGALFDYHPTIQTATFERLNTTFPATANVPDRWTFEEEVYNFRSDPRDNGAVVVLTVDESSYTNNGTSSGNYPSQGSPHPSAWYIESPLSAQPLLANVPKAGRSFYTSLGHLNSTWQNETFINHVMSGLKWALDGASTRAYGVGLVGNNTSTSGASASASASTGASGSASGTASRTSPSGSGAASAASASGSKSAGERVVGVAIPGGGKGMVAAAGVVGAVVAGVSMVL